MSDSLVILDGNYRVQFKDCTRDASEGAAKEPMIRIYSEMPGRVGLQIRNFCPMGHGKVNRHLYAHASLKADDIDAVIRALTEAKRRLK